MGLPGGRRRADRPWPPGRAPETVATAIRIGNPASWNLATGARDESGGRIDAAPDDQILHAYRELARLEGVFCEPASAASVAGVGMVAAAAGEVERDAAVVCVLTGNGLKDPHTAERWPRGSKTLEQAEPTIAGVAQGPGGLGGAINPPGKVPSPTCRPGPRLPRCRRAG